MFERSLASAGWVRSEDGLSARLRPSRALPSVLVGLVLSGVVMYGYFLSVADGPYAWPAYMAPVALLFALYAALRGLRKTAHMRFVDGVFHCTSGALGLHESTSIALADLKRFEGRGPTDHRDVAHVVAHVNGATERLPIPVADAAPIGGDDLALAVAAALNDMLEDARRARRGYR